jgi:hypothetical protein
MISLHPEIEPYATGMLALGDGDEVYWETCGNPAGKPAVVLHGGPGQVLAVASEAVRPERVPHRAVRSAQLRPQQTQRE